jgi:hypothetical protein
MGIRAADSLKGAVQRTAGKYLHRYRPIDAKTV